MNRKITLILLLAFAGSLVFVVQRKAARIGRGPGPRAPHARATANAAIESARARCEAKDKEACRKLVGLLEEAEDTRDIGKYYEWLCFNTLDEIESCRMVGFHRAADAMDEAVRKCGEGNSRECFVALGSKARYRLRGEAEEFARSVCLEKRNLLVCYAFGRLAPASERQDAVSRCFTHDPLSCFIAAGSAEGLSTVYFKSACLAGSIDGCGFWGTNAQEAEIQEQRSGCEKGNAQACAVLAGFDYRNRRAKSAEERLSRACSLGASRACELGAEVKSACQFWKEQGC